MNDEDVARIRKEFDSFDKDNNGLIDLQEFVDMIASLYPKSDSSYIEGGFTLIDDNGDGLIDFEEFLRWWQDEDWED